MNSFGLVKYRLCLSILPFRAWHLLACTSAAACLNSCGTADKCAEFPRELTYTTKSMQGFSALSREHEGVLSAQERVESCVANTSYYDPVHPLRFVGARIDSKGKYYLIYNPYGVEDQWIVFDVDQRGNFVKVFSYSPL